MNGAGRIPAAILLLLGLLQMTGDIVDVPVLKGIGAASAASAKAFILTNGSGNIRLLDAHGRLQRPISRTQWAWDNHACAV